MDQALLQQRLREARAGEQSTTCASLPPEILASIVEHAFPYSHKHHYTSWSGSWLGSFLRMGCINSSFLESLKYVTTLQIDLSYRLFRRFPTVPNGVMLPARYDADVRRWCDIASRRLRHVLIVTECGGGNAFNPVQTKHIVDCVASFPNVCEFTMNNTETVSTCMSLSAALRAGRFSILQKLTIDGAGDMCILRKTTSSTFNVRRIAKFAFQELISVLPPDRGIECLVEGVFPELMEIGDETSWGLWAATFFSLVGKGVDVRSRPILGEIAYMHQNSYEGFRESVDGMMTFYCTVELLLMEHGVDPNAPYDVAHWMSRTPLWMILDSLAETIEVVQSDLLAEADPEVESDFEPMIDSELVVPMLRFFMRTVDLLVRHGARSTRADCATRCENENTTLHPWILARPDCTQAIRDAVARGDLFHDKHAL